jgi:hypothetical protein
MSGKSFLQGIPYARLYNSESSHERRNAMNEWLTKVVTKRANLALYGSKDKTRPVFKKDASMDFNPYPNLDMSTQTPIETPKPEVPHVYSTDQTTPQSGKKIGDTKVGKFFSNLFSPREYRGKRTRWLRRSRSGPSHRQTRGRGN